MSNTPHQWFYMKKTMLSEDQVGPVSENELKELAVAGGVNPDTKIASPTRTNSQWRLLKTVPTLLQLYERGVAAKQSQKEHEKEVKQAAKQVDREMNQTPPIPKPATDSSNSKIEGFVQSYLTSGEEIELICKQQKPIAIKADAVVVTNRRLMIVRPKLLGRFEFDDCLWRDLQDAHVKENLMGATFSATSISGSRMTIDMLPKKGARRLYQIAQEREEQAIEIRRNRKIEETAAGAAKFNLNSSAPTPPASSGGNDPMTRLAKLKEMLTAGLISDQDFQDRKREILKDV
jgi:hypothetical protein